MSNPQRTPIQQLHIDQSSYISQPPFRQTQFAYQLPKIDHAFIVENYRRLRIHQRDQLARLRMPDDLKRKIFNFKEDQDLKHEKPDLVIFNHPFRGKMVMTRNEVEKQLQRERKNAQIAEEFQGKGQKIPQNILNEMGLQDEQLQLKRTKMFRQEPLHEPQENYPRKPRLVSNQPQKKTAEQINKQQQKIQQDEMYFIHKGDNEYKTTQKQRTEKVQKLIDQKQKANSNKKGFNENDDKAKSKEKRLRFGGYNVNDMPIIGEEPKVVRDIKFQSARTITSNNPSKPIPMKQDANKRLYRPSGQQTQEKYIQRNIIQRKNVEPNIHKFGSGEGLLSKRQNYQEENLDKSISEISAIPSNDQDEDLSNSQSLNKALFMD